MSERKLSNIVVMKIKRDLMATNLGFAQIGRRHKVPANTVREMSLGNIYADVGVFTYPMRPIGKPRGAKVSAAKEIGVKKLLDEGRSVREVSKLTGVARGTVTKIKEEEE